MTLASLKGPIQENSYLSKKKSYNSWVTIKTQTEIIPFPPTSPTYPKEKHILDSGFLNMPCIQGSPTPPVFQLLFSLFLETFFLLFPTSTSYSFLWPTSFITKIASCRQANSISSASKRHILFTAFIKQSSILRVFFFLLCSCESLGECTARVFPRLYASTTTLLHAWVQQGLPNSLLHQSLRTLDEEGDLFLNYISIEHQPWRLRLVKTKVSPNVESEGAWEILLLEQVSSLPQKNGENSSGKKCHSTHTHIWKSYESTNQRP